MRLLISLSEPCSAGAGAIELQYVVGCADECPFATHLFYAPQQELSEAACLFDLSEDRFNDGFARRVDCAYLAKLVAEHRMDEDEAHEVALDLTSRLPLAAYRLTDNA